ncbi:M4 family metallopeptidase [Colwellia sp. TT2012]|uniref:M4 family metallopeptidase n=1 Tax=Colwellia sp. TT2012 TaxID=1720342 RepID=UPI00070CAF5C|nr:pre-peptidase C-terminal domain-containing protein [Colwellia sp. TT2012]
MKYLSLTALAVTSVLSGMAQAATLSNAATIDFNQGAINSMTAQPTALTGLGFKAVKTVTLTNGTKKTRYQQLYMGVPVYGTSVVAPTAVPGIMSMTSTIGSTAQGNILTGIAGDIKNTKAKYSDKAALNILRASNNINNVSLVQVRTENEQSELFVYLDDNGVARLVYLTSYFVHQPTPSRPYAIIDANTGEIIKKWEGLTMRQATGPGGNTKTGRYVYGVDYPALTVDENCRMSTSNVNTIDMNHQTWGGSIFQFNCPENNYKSINGAFSPLNDAHYFGNVIFDMYQDWFNAAPLNFKLTMKVHYGYNYQNAFWNGREMTFGDGGSVMYPMVTLDVSAHEVSHGFTEQNSGLVYMGHSGGMNESFSDMAGEAAEYFMKGTNDWIIGGELMKFSDGMRFLDDPTKDNRSIAHINDYYDGIDVHHSSGLYNKVFYTLAHKAGWNTRTAFEVFTLANQLYWTANSTFTAGAQGVCSAAIDKGLSVQDIQDSFAVVGIDSGCATTAPIPTDATELVNGVRLTGQSAERGSEVFYTVTVPENSTSLDIAITGGSGDADIYTRFGVVPTTKSFDCRPFVTGNEESCQIAEPTAGVYHVMLKAFTSYDNMTITATFDTSTTTPIPIPADNVLVNGVPVTGLTAGTGESVRYTLQVTEGATALSFVTSGGQGDADLYVAFDREPTKSEYDYRPYESGNDETVTIALPKTGTYHVMVRAYSEFSDVALMAAYTPAVPTDSLPNACVSQEPLGYNKVEDGQAICTTANSGDFFIYIDSDVTTVTIRTGGGTGNVDLYASYGNWPSPTDHQYKSTNMSNNEKIVVTGQQGWLMINTHSNGSSTNVTLQVDLD